jgi:hypothetical protein
MKCPHCDKEIPGSLCPKCGETVYEDATYCMSCATPLKESARPAHQGKNFFGDSGGEDIDFDNRVLCPDGTCTGIIVDGRCSECGKAEGDEDSLKKETEETEAKEEEGEVETTEPTKEETTEPTKEKDA